MLMDIEMKRALMEARDAIERSGIMMGIGPDADLAEEAWDRLNGMLGCGQEDCIGCECKPY